MANISEDGNHTAFQQFFSCSNDLNGVQNYIISTLNAFIAITAFPGNVLIIVALQKVSSLRPSSKLLLSCLATTDLCVGLILQPLLITYLLSPDHSELCNYFGYISPILALTFCSVSLLTSTAISVDRLLALILGLTYRNTVTIKRVWAFVIMSWLGSIACAMVYLYDYAISTYITCAGLLFCVTTSTFCYVKIYRTLHRHQSQIQGHIYLERPSRREIPLNIARYRKTVSSALWVSMTLVACYLPFAIITLVAYIANIFTPTVTLFFELAVTLVQFNSSLNPVLYCWKIREVRQAVKDTTRRFLCLES